jgi:hypothetical protein
VRGRPALGEIALALVLAATGVLWAAVAAQKPLWQGFAPDTGFLPLLYGVLLALLSLLILAELFLKPGDGDSPAQPILKPLMLLVALVATVVGISVVGFAVAVFLMLVFLYAGLERLPLHYSLLVAAATTAFLVLVFKVWLAVPLPLGPIGI